MASHESIAFWGPNNLKRWPKAYVEDLRIANSSKQFLAHVGLPCNENWTLRFDCDAESLPRLARRPSFRRFGFDGAVPICLDEDFNGRVVADETEINGEERMINSSVEHFGEFLVLYQQYRHSARIMSEDQVLALIPRIERRMREIDPDALHDPSSYWPLILEQMKQGLL